MGIIDKCRVVLVMIYLVDGLYIKSGGSRFTSIALYIFAQKKIIKINDFTSYT